MSAFEMLGDPDAASCEGDVCLPPALAAVPREDERPDEDPTRTDGLKPA